MIAGTLSRYFGMRFLTALIAVFVGVFALVVLVDYVELMRRSCRRAERLGADRRQDLAVPRAAGRPSGSCRSAVLIGAMSCYLGLSRRLELVVARAAGMSAWQFIAPALVVALVLRRPRHHRLQSGRRDPAGAVQAPGGGDVRQQRPNRPAGDRERLLGPPAQ